MKVLAAALVAVFSREELSKTTPLFQHRDSATLVIKFD